MVRSLFLALVFLAGAGTAWAEEGNNLAAVERPAGSGVYYSGPAAR